jgi:hypothetical protein
MVKEIKEQKEQKQTTFDIKAEIAKTKQQKKINLQKQGLAEFFTYPVGETKTFFMLEKGVETQEGQFGTKKVFRVVINNEEFSVSFALSPALKVLDALDKGINPMTVIRAGTEKATRYDIKELHQ